MYIFADQVKITLNLENIYKFFSYRNYKNATDSYIEIL